MALRTYKQSVDHTSLKEKLLKWYTMSPATQLIPGLISCAGVTGRWVLMCTNEMSNIGKGEAREGGEGGEGVER